MAPPVRDVLRGSTGFGTHTRGSPGDVLGHELRGLQQRLVQVLLPAVCVGGQRGEDRRRTSVEVVVEVLVAVQLQDLDDAVPPEGGLDLPIGDGLATNSASACSETTLRRPAGPSAATRVARGR